MNEFKEALFRIFTWLLIVIIGGCLFAALAMLTIRSVFGADEVLIPENQEIILGWGHERDGDTSIFYRIMIGTNLHATIRSTNISGIVASTNGGPPTIVARVPGFPKGTNSLTVIAVSDIYTNSPSDPSTNLAIRALGKPSAPQAPRKL